MAGPSGLPLKDQGSQRLSEYNFNIGLAQLVTTLKDIKEAKFPREILSNLDKRNQDVWFDFYNTHRHLSGDCELKWRSYSGLGT